VRILVLCKRRYTGLDLIGDRYGRLFELPAQLAALGHEVTGIALDYRGKHEADFPVNDALPHAWASIGLRRSPWSRIRHAIAISKEFRPDVVWASSDVLCLGLGTHIAKVTNCASVMDIYDNYEAFGLTKLPGMRAWLHSTLRHATAVTVAGNALKEYAKTYTRDGDCIEVITNGFDSTIFFDGDQACARKSLGLPATSKLIGTAGALSTSRDIEVLLRALTLIRSNRPDILLAVAGPRDSKLYLDRNEGIIDLGVLAPMHMGDFYNSLDVGVVCNTDSLFGRYCQPMKLVEMLACKTPVVAAGVGESAALLEHVQGALYRPGDAKDLAARIVFTLDNGNQSPAIRPPTWESLAKKLETILLSAREMHKKSTPSLK